jgi:hypothetical protein
MRQGRCACIGHAVHVLPDTVHSAHTSSCDGSHRLSASRTVCVNVPL